MRKLIILSALFLSFGVLANTEKTADVSKIEIHDTIILPIFAIDNVLIPENEIASVSFKAGQIAEIDASLLQGVTIKGYTRKVSVQNQEIGQILASYVVKGDKEVLISEKGFTTQFDAKETPELSEEKMLTVEGSKIELETALKKLTEEENKEEKPENKNDRQAVEASDSSGYQTVGKENDLAGSYSTPTPVTYEEEKSPVVAIETSKEGCEIVIDEAQGVAIEQAKSITLTDGVKTAETECSETLTRYLIKEYQCENLVDLQKMQVYPQTKKSYANSEGATIEVSECTPNYETPMELKEDDASCTPTIDYSNNQVIFRTALIYTNVNGSKAEARGCEPSETIAPIPLLESVESCPLKHDFAGNKSYEMSLKYYEKDGQKIQATSCVNTGVEYEQTKAYGICPNIIDKVGQVVTLQSRRQITIDGVPQYVSGCTPDTTGTQIVGTTENCSIRHDLQASVSYQQKRYYYNQAGTQIWLPEGCVDSEINYPHQLEIMGYEHHDEQKFSYPKMKITIDTPSGEQTVASGVVLDGSAQIPYVFDRNSTIGTGEFEYSGCNRREKRQISDIYKRADNSEYATAGVPTTPSSWVDVCIVENQSRNYHKARLSGASHNGSTLCCGTDPYGNCGTRPTVATTQRTGYFADKGWCSSNSVGTYSCASFTYLVNTKTWEAQRITQTRQKKTNPYTSDIFYTSWVASQTVNTCPSLSTCSTTQTQWNNWTIGLQNASTADRNNFINYETSWSNCSDYVP